MARQTGLIKLRGTIDGVLYYEMMGEHFARKASSLNGKRFKKDKAFENSRKSGSRFGLASKLAKEVYRTIEKAKRNVDQYRALVKKAVALYTEGAQEASIRGVLLQYAGSI